MSMEPGATFVVDDSAFTWSLKLAQDHAAYITAKQSTAGAKMLAALETAVELGEKGASIVEGIAALAGEPGISAGVAGVAALAGGALKMLKSSG